MHCYLLGTPLVCLMLSYKSSRTVVLALFYLLTIIFCTTALCFKPNFIPSYFPYAPGPILDNSYLMHTLSPSCCETFSLCYSTVEIYIFTVLLFYFTGNLDKSNRVSDIPWSRSAVPLSRPQPCQLWYNHSRQFGTGKIRRQTSQVPITEQCLTNYDHSKIIHIERNSGPLQPSCRL